MLLTEFCVKILEWLVTEIKQQNVAHNILLHFVTGSRGVDSDYFSSEIIPSLFKSLAMFFGHKMLHVGSNRPINYLARLRDMRFVTIRVYGSESG